MQHPVVALARPGRVGDGVVTVAESGWVALAAGVVVVSAAWVYVDAHSIGARRGLRRGFTDLGPLGWASCTLLLWIVTLPLYLAARPGIRAAARERDRPLRPVPPVASVDQPGWQQLRAFGGPGLEVIDLTDPPPSDTAGSDTAPPDTAPADTAPPDTAPADRPPASGDGSGR